MAIELKTPKAIIFDWDNTLVNTWPLIHNALYETFNKYGLTPWSLQETKDNVGHSLRNSFPVLFGENWERAGADYQAFYQRDHLSKLQILPLSEDVLQYLHDKGVYLAVVSNKKGHNLRAEAEHIGWAKYFDKLIGSDDAPNDKPHPDPVYMALEGSGLKAGDEVWFVGDTAVDLECAKNTGCSAVLYGEAVVENLEEGLRYRGFDVQHFTPDHHSFLALLKQKL
ncbi:MAG: HAD family hydrolase [Alphaproteobacteria bacterium]|nr:HAD family hydrolase [Alphaproteobacteria bacterium]